VVADLVRASGEIDIYVITGEAGKSRPMARRLLRRTSPWAAYAKSASFVALFTAVLLILGGLR